MLRNLWRGLVVVSVLASPLPASAQWVHSDWQWKCSGSYSLAQHRYWVTQSDRADSGRVTAKRITVHVNVEGDRRTKVCENADRCEWLMEGQGLGCHRSCSRADVIFADDRTLNTDEQCAK
jgi:hypothetical protein